MGRSLADLLRLLDLEEIEPDIFRGPTAETQLQRTYGGQVLAQAVMAAYRTAPPDRWLHAVHAIFLEAGRADAAILYHVESTRDGGSFSSRRVVAQQQGRRMFALTAMFHVDEAGLDHADVMTEVPAPESCPSMREVVAERLGERSARFWTDWDDLEVRFVGQSGVHGDITAVSHAAHQRVWVRANGTLPDEPRLHHAVLAYLSDLTLLAVSTVGHPVVFASRELQAASLDHGMWFHRPFRADQWLLYDQVSPSASNALGFSLGRLYQDGRLVANTSQQGLVRVVPPERR